MIDTVESYAPGFKASRHRPPDPLAPRPRARIRPCRRRHLSWAAEPRPALFGKAGARTRRLPLAVPGLVHVRRLDPSRRRRHRRARPQRRARDDPRLSARTMGSRLGAPQLPISDFSSRREPQRSPILGMSEEPSNGSGVWSKCGPLAGRPSPTCLAKLDRKTRSALLLSQLTPTSPNSSNGRARGANRLFPAADARVSPELRRAFRVGSRAPPPTSGLSAQLHPSRPSPLMSPLRPSFRTLGTGAAGQKAPPFREAPIVGVADHTSNERSFAHQV